MHTARFSWLPAAALAVVVVGVGCGGGSSAVTGPEDVPVAVGSAVIQGTVVGGGYSVSPGAVVASPEGSALIVSVEGTPLSTAVDQEGEFILSSVPAGSVSLLFDGPGVSARLTVSGVQDRQVMSLEVHVSGDQAQVNGPVHCAPTAETKIVGTLDAMDGDQLVVGGHTVDASQVKKVWRGSRGIALNNLVVGEKVKVWGTLRGDGVIVAEEIQALSNGEKEWVTLEGRVTQVAQSALDVHANPNGGSGTCATYDASSVHASPNSGACPTFWVDGVKVVTDGHTGFWWSDGRPLDPSAIKVGQHARVEGWRKPGSHVVATSVIIG
jgi:hypothetical protein